MIIYCTIVVTLQKNELKFNDDCSRKAIYGEFVFYLQIKFPLIVILI